MAEVRETVLGIAVHFDNENPLFGAQSTHVLLKDESGGGFVEIRQIRGDGKDGGSIELNPEEIDVVFNAAKRILNQYDVAVRNAANYKFKK